MVREVSEFHEELETELVCNLTHFQVLHGCEEGDLHNQCDREPEFHLPETEPSEKRISQRHRPAEGIVSGYFRGHEKWTMPIRNWGQVYGELSIMYEGRLPE